MASITLKRGPCFIRIVGNACSTYPLHFIGGEGIQRPTEQKAFTQGHKVVAEADLKARSAGSSKDSSLPLCEVTFCHGHSVLSPRYYSLVAPLH